MSAADLDRVMKIAESLQHAPHWPLSSYVSAIDPSCTPPRIALVAEGESRDPIGFLIACLIAPEAELETIAVAAEAKRRGIGTALLSALMRELKAERVGGLLLEVRVSNQEAQDFYAALGFEQIGQRPRYYADPEEDAVLLRLGIE